MRPSLLLIGLSLLALGCQPQNEIDAIRSKYEKDAWSHFDTVGRPDPEYLYMASMSANTGTLRAIAVSSGTREEREYKTGEYVYRTATFQSPQSGDTFTLVFRKKKE